MTYYVSSGTLNLAKLEHKLFDDCNDDSIDSVNVFMWTIELELFTGMLSDYFCYICCL